MSDPMASAATANVCPASSEADAAVSRRRLQGFHIAWSTCINRHVVSSLVDGMGCVAAPRGFSASCAAKASASRRCCRRALDCEQQAADRRRGIDCE
jgi:hypothetical protein